MLETGPGKWVDQETKKMSIEAFASRSSKYKTVAPVKAEPTYSHNAISSLLQSGTMKHLISQNIDGLHRRAGVKADQISELHGNTYLESCKGCGADYMRTFKTRAHGLTSKEHNTGRFCDHCGEELHDNIVNFGESLPSKVPSFTHNKLTCASAWDLVCKFSLQICFH